MLKYEITAFQRSEIMDAMEWAMWAIREHIEREQRSLVGDAEVVATLMDEANRFGHLWDAINSLKG